uniref:chitin synthase n=1 Tax=Branchiostoma floridae TaxID=7739 RepID=C3ZFZ3_BRAFL|eukprot:XP_002592457.1 hypothetical protein BRAFLDRAFT_68943 [Branchiostoma floridae]
MATEVRYFGAWDYVVFAVMLCISAGIGLYYACTGGKQRTQKEFLMADKSMSIVPVTMSLLASFISAITVLGTPAEVYNNGTMFWNFAVADGIAMVVVARLFVPTFYNLGLTSTYEYLEIRFSKPVRLLTTVVFMVNMLVYMGLVLYTPSLALNAVTGLTLWGAVAAVGVVCTFYTTLGGMKAVMWTDTFQIVVMVAGFLAVIIQGTIEVGGPARVWEINGQGERLEFFNHVFRRLDDPNGVRRLIFGLGGSSSSQSVRNGGRADARHLCSRHDVSMCQQMGTQDPKEMDPKLFIPFYDRFFCCLPNSWLKWLRCGVPSGDEDSEAIDVKMSNAASNPTFLPDDEETKQNGEPTFTKGHGADIVENVTSTQDPKEMDPKLFIPFYDRFFCCLPNSWLKWLRCGVPSGDELTCKDFVLSDIIVVSVAVAEYRMVCYYTNWAQYRKPPWNYVPENVDPNLCTHVIYAFANMEDNRLKPLEWNDEDLTSTKGMYSSSSSRNLTLVQPCEDEFPETIVNMILLMLVIPYGITFLGCLWSTGLKHNHPWPTGKAILVIGDVSVMWSLESWTNITSDHPAFDEMMINISCGLGGYLLSVIACSFSFCLAISATLALYVAQVIAVWSLLAQSPSGILEKRSQIDFGEPMSVTGLLMQVEQSYGQSVPRFQLRYMESSNPLKRRDTLRLSDDDWIRYRDSTDGPIKTFTVSEDGIEEPVKILLKQPIKTRFLRIYPTKCHGMRFEVLGHPLNDRLANTYILMTDGDVKFKSEAVRSLLDIAVQNPSVGAVCARTHPIGSGPVAWYQIFDYAIAHWLGKTANNMMGTVLCCPGCFSVYRANAVRDGLSEYSSHVKEANDFLVKDMGEDRWFCTLLIKHGWTLEYSAMTEDFTYCPETFEELFKQRRRWLLSSLVNPIIIAQIWKTIVVNNHNFSRPFLLYQILLIVSSIVTPGTCLILVAGGVELAFGLSLEISMIVWSLATVAYGVVCLYAQQNTQLKVLMMSPLTLTYLLVFGVVLGVQFLSMVVHRGWTLVHMLARIPNPWETPGSDVSPKISGNPATATMAMSLHTVDEEIGEENGYFNESYEEGTTMTEF